MSDPPAHKKLRPAGEDGEEEDPAVTRFREYLRIPTISATDNTKSAYGEQRTVRAHNRQRLTVLCLCRVSGEISCANG